MSSIPNCHNCIHKNVCYTHRQLHAVLSAALCLKEHTEIYMAVAKNCSMHQIDTTVKPKKHKKGGGERYFF